MPEDKRVMRGTRWIAAATFMLLGPFLVSCSKAPSPRGGTPATDSSAEPLPPEPAKPVNRGPASIEPKPTPRPAPPIPAPDRATAVGPIHHRAEKHLPGRENPATDQPTTDHPATDNPVPAPPPTDDQLLESALGKLKKGNLAYSTPQKMTTGKTAHVVARIANDTVSVEVLKSDLPSGQNEKIETAATPISTRMKMTLKGADFDITPLSSEEQIVAGNTATQWEWDIVPKHSGKLRLHLAAVVELNGLAKDFTTVDREIPVDVDPVDAVTKFISTNWQWLIATLTALGGATWKYFSSRKEKAAA
ncbi:MAG: hypothetical protein JWM43_4203 [Acidobacteriaceae bacterium]|nr:hypothetical protein [Acidobacteriaceae bacterium]